MQITPIFFESLRTAFDKTSHDWASFAEEWGHAWGRRAVVDLETEVLESFDRLLRELPMVTVAEVVAAYLRRHGWGQLTVDFGPANRGVFLLRLQRNALAESLGPSASPRCQLFAGFFGAVFSHLANKRLVVREARCISQGHPHCELVVANMTRASAIDGSLAESGGDVEKLVELLRRAASSRRS